MSRDLVQSTELQFDLTRLQAAVDAVLAVHPFRPGHQLNLTTREAAAQSPYELSGSLYDVPERKALHWEQEFKYFLREFEGTYLHEVYKTVNEALGGTVGRVRLMRLQPRECYTFHKDDNVRYHLAVRTHRAAFIAFQSGLHHIPADGRVYRVDTTQPHTALNGGREDRVHLVISTSSVPMDF